MPSRSSRIHGARFMLPVMVQDALLVPKKHSQLAPGGALVMMQRRILITLEWWEAECQARPELHRTAHLDSSLRETRMIESTKMSHRDPNRQPPRHPRWKATQLTRVML